jgi:hypothetical protein
MGAYGNWKRTSLLDRSIDQFACHHSIQEIVPAWHVISFFPNWLVPIEITSVIPDQFETMEPVYIDRLGKMIESRLLVKHLQ